MLRADISHHRAGITLYRHFPNLAEIALASISALFVTGRSLVNQFLTGCVHVVLFREHMEN